MRWKVEEKKIEHRQTPSRGETQTISKFLFWPKKLKGSERGRLAETDTREEYRWLETAKIKQVWENSMFGQGWEDFCWAD